MGEKMDCHRKNICPSDLWGQHFRPQALRCIAMCCDVCFNYLFILHLIWFHCIPFNSTASICLALSGALYVTPSVTTAATELQQPQKSNSHIAGSKREKKNVANDSNTKQTVMEAFTLKITTSPMQLTQQLSYGRAYQHPCFNSVDSTQDCFLYWLALMQICIVSQGDLSFVGRWSSVQAFKSILSAVVIVVLFTMVCFEAS